MRSQKMDHAIRSQGWVARSADKPPGHGERMNNRHISDIHESEARARPRPHQPIPSQYRRWRGHGSEVRGYGLAVGRGENHSRVPAQAFLGEMFCWDDILPKGSKDELGPLGACHERQEEREHSHCNMVGKQTKQPSLSGSTANTGKWWWLSD